MRESRGRWEVRRGFCEVWEEGRDLGVVRNARLMTRECLY